MWGDSGKQGDARPREGGHTIKHRHTCAETMGNDGSGRQTHHPRRTRHPTWAHMWADNGRLKGKQGPGKAGTPSTTGTRAGRLWETREDKTSGRRHTIHHKHTSNTVTHVVKQRQGEARPRKDGHAMQQRHTCGETWARRGRRETTREMGGNGKQCETRGEKFKDRITPQVNFVQKFPVGRG